MVPLYRKVPAGNGFRYYSLRAQEAADEINQAFVHANPAWVDGDGCLVFRHEGEEIRPRGGDWIVLDEHGIHAIPVEQFTRDFLPPPGRAF